MALRTVGVFDSVREVEMVREDLLQAGIAPNAIEIHVQDGQPPREEGREHGLLGWLQSLFGDDGRDHAESYAEAVRRGGHVVSVVTEDTAEAERVGEIMVRNGAVDMDRRTAQWRSEGWTGFQEGSPAYSPEAIERERELRADEKERIPVVEEELEVGKRDVRTGHVRVVSYVVAQPAEARVTLREEHAEIERHPVDRPASEADLRAAQGETIEVTERAEEPVATKKARVVEEVEVGKRTSEHEEVVRDEVRKTRVDVERDDADAARRASR
jgi:uncharacterized protein (TIGR02271 family)